MKKVMYFAVGAKTTGPEAEEIAALRASEYTVVVRNSADESAMMLGNRREECDYVVGTVPDLYEDKPSFQAPIPGAAQVTDGLVLSIGPNNYTFTVVGGEITAIEVEGA